MLIFYGHRGHSDIGPATFKDLLFSILKQTTDEMQHWETSNWLQVDGKIICIPLKNNILNAPEHVLCHSNKHS